MRRFAGKVIATPEEDSPFAAVIYANDRIVWRALVRTHEEGKLLITEFLEKLRGFEKKSLH
jgi:hypothetical protein